MDIPLTDVMLHIDENLNHGQREWLETHMRSQSGVVGLGFHDKQPHLMIVGYNPDKTTSMELLHCVTDQGLHAELIGL